MPYVIFLCLAGLFIVLGAVFAAGKGSGLIAGFNTAAPEEKAKYDKKKLCRAMAVLMFALAFCFLVSAAGGMVKSKALTWAGQGLFALFVIAGVVWLNTGNRMKKQ